MPSPVPPSSAPAHAPTQQPENSGATENPPQASPAATDSTALPDTMRSRAARYRAGEMVEAWIGGTLRHRGVVDESAPHLGVVWIQELGTGMRIMLDLAETELSRHTAPRADPR